MMQINTPVGSLLLSGKKTNQLGQRSSKVGGWLESTEYSQMDLCIHTSTCLAKNKGQD